MNSIIKSLILACILCASSIFYGCGDEGSEGDCVVNSDCNDGFQCVSGACQEIGGGGNNNTTAPSTSETTSGTTDGPGTSTSTGGVECGEGEVDCDGTCVDENTVDHCGGCSPCAEPKVGESVACSENGECVYTCEDGFVDLDPEVPGCECTPSEEVCDDIDNDCDGETDEGVLNACGTCGDVPEEVCDDIDNDCDGETDEGLEGCICEPSEEICDGIDNDCDGETDEGVLNACGECGPLPEEVCDSVDNDCDGEVDEGVLNACGTCGDVPEEICDGLDNNCNGETDEGVLNACGACGDVPQEICDGIDNNCDGEIDETGSQTSCGSLDNAAASECVAGVCMYTCTGDFVDANSDLSVENSDGCECLPSADPTEICDGIDNDCDGDTDTLGVDFSSCLPLMGAEGSACESGRCVYTCRDTFVDLDSDLNRADSNGCECERTRDDEICDGMDNNCDGIIDEGCDDDNDGFCDLDLEYVVGNAVLRTCSNGPGDCNDEVPDVNPNVVEICDGVDNDCINGVDERCDDDNDGFCDFNIPFEEGGLATCPHGPGDCNDAAETINPDAAEICDGIDNNCNNATDDADDTYADFCPNQEGVCQGSLKTCLVGSPQVCVQETYEAHAILNDRVYSNTTRWGEVYYDEIDNDCDGEVDEDLELDDTCLAVIDSTGVGFFVGRMVQPTIAVNTTQTRALVAYVAREATNFETGEELTGRGGVLVYGVINPKTFETIKGKTVIFGNFDQDVYPNAGWPSATWSDSDQAFVMTYRVQTNAYSAGRGGNQLEYMKFDSDGEITTDRTLLPTNGTSKSLYAPPAITSNNNSTYIAYAYSTGNRIEVCSDFFGDWSCSVNEEISPLPAPAGISPVNERGQIRYIANGSEQTFATTVTTYLSSTLYMGNMDAFGSENILDQPGNNYTTNPALAVTSTGKILYQTNTETHVRVDLYDPVLNESTMLIEEDVSVANYRSTPKDFYFGVDPESDTWRLIWHNGGVFFSMTGGTDPNRIGYQAPIYHGRIGRYQYSWPLGTSILEKKVTMPEVWNPKEVTPVIISDYAVGSVHAMHLLPSGHLTCLAEDN